MCFAYIRVSSYYIRYSTFVLNVVEVSWGGFKLWPQYENISIKTGVFENRLEHHCTILTEHKTLDTSATEITTTQLCAKTSQKHSKSTNDAFVIQSFKVSVIAHTTAREQFKLAKSLTCKQDGENDNKLIDTVSNDVLHHCPRNQWLSSAIRLSFEHFLIWQLCCQCQWCKGVHYKVDPQHLNSFQWWLL